ncbi:MAG TPA: hypothetical protein VF026_30300 [Ktedonobacteraceae bacterium]
MPELITARCTQGKLTITDTHILIERIGKSQSMPRSSFTGVDMKLALWLIMSSYTLTFHGAGGERLKASMVRGKDAKRIRNILTGR